MADAALHICSVLYSFCRKKKISNLHIFTHCLHILCFLYLFYVKKMPKNKKKKWLTLSLHIDCILYSFHGQKKCKKINLHIFKKWLTLAYTFTSFYTHFKKKKIKKIKKWLTLPYTFYVFYTRF